MTPAPRRRRLVIAAVAVAVVAGAVTWALLPPPRAAFDAEVARLRAAGFATTYAEAIEPMPPAAENGGPDLLAAFAALRARRGHPWHSGVTGPWDTDAAEPWYVHAAPEQLAALAAALDRAAPFFDAVDAALRKPRCVFPDSWDEFGLPKSDWLPPFGGIEELLCAKAHAASSPEARLSAIRALADLGVRGEASGSLAAMVRTASRARAVEAARHAAESDAVPAADLLAVLAEPLSRSLVATIPRVARGDLPFAATTLDLYLRGDDPLGLLPADDVVDRWMRKLRGRGPGAFERVGIATSFEPPSDAVAAADLRALAAIATADVRDLRAQIDRAVAAAGAGERSSAASLARLHIQWLRKDAAAALALVALAARARHDATGAWPTSLDDLAAAFPSGVPRDPRTGTPFDYAVTADAVRVAAPRDAAALETEAQLRADGLVWTFAR